jgi:O-antigen/teichoic acid export membrane protein
MNINHLKSLSASGFQIIVNQLFGLGFFMLAAYYIDKQLFGELNLSIALSTTFTLLATFGFDHVIVRRISAGMSIASTTGIYLTHALVMGLLSIILLLVSKIYFPNFFQIHFLLIAVFISFICTYIASCFKQLANGKERFWHLAFMGIIANVVRVIGLFFLIQIHAVTISNIAILYVGVAIVEVLFAFFSAAHLCGHWVLPSFNWMAYKSLVKESLPQLGVIFLESSLARVDWILLGFISTSVFVADYSFAYKAFESSRIPLLIIAPVLLPKISRILAKSHAYETSVVKELNMLWQLESWLAMLIPLILNICWVDVVNIMTQNKYGESTKGIYAILSFCLPMAYITNFLWTIVFAKGNIKLTLKISALASVVNIVLNIILIKYYNAIGAAIAYLASTTVQFVCYYVWVKEPHLQLRLMPYLKTLLIAILLYVLAMWLPVLWLWKVIIISLLYISLFYFLFYKQQMKKALSISQDGL